MRRNLTRMALLATILATWTPLVPSFEPAKNDESARAIKDAIRDLGDDRYKVRDKASASLWKAGRAAEPALVEAAAKGDAEVARRARAILDKFKWGLYPDTPKDIIEIIEAYRGGDAVVRMKTLRELLAKGKTYHYLLHKFANAEEDQVSRETFWGDVGVLAPEIVRSAMLDSNLDLAEEVLEFDMAHPDPRFMHDYVAFLHLRGQLDRKIAELEPQVAKKSPHDQARLLAYLQRARGDLAAALRAAERTGADDFVTALLLEQGNWPALSERLASQVGTGFLGADELDVLGFRLAFYRLEGNVAKADETAQALRVVAKGLVTQDPLYAWLAAKILIINERQDEALAVLKDNKLLVDAMDLLMAQLRFEEAFALADQADTPALKVQTTIAKGRALWLVGEKEKATILFKKVAATAAGDNTEDWQPLTELLETEHRLGIHDLLYEHAAKMLGSQEPTRFLSVVMLSIFPNHVEEAEVWYSILSRGADAPAPAERLRSVASLLEGKTPVAVIRALADQGEKLSNRLSPEERQSWLAFFAAGFSRAHADEEAERYLRKAVAVEETATTVQRLGDFLADKKRWPEAAEQYQRAWELDRSQATPLYLRGHALTQSGQEAEGQKLITQSHWLPLGDEEQRKQLAVAMAKRKSPKEARREWEFILRTCDHESEPVQEALRQLAADGLARDEHQAVADGFERYALTRLRTGSQALLTESYCFFPQWIHQYRGLARLKAGKSDDAVREAKLAIEAHPQNVDVAIALIPALAKAGRNKEADELYAELRKKLSEVCTAYPKCASERNGLAWLMAGCKRDLDLALPLAEAALQLEPKTSAYLDTLAEIHFQRGDQEKAIQLMKQCLELDTKKTYYQLQLKRFEAGDRGVAIPKDNSGV